MPRTQNIKILLILEWRLWILGVLCFLFACEESSDWDLNTAAHADNPQLVVEGILTNENKIQEIRLTQTYADLNGEPPAVLEAEVEVDVQVKVNNVIYNFQADSVELGYYKSETAFQVLEGLEYVLDIQYDGQHYEASSRLSEVTPMHEIDFIPFGNTDSLQIKDFVLIYSPNQQSMYELNIDWSSLSVEENSFAKLYYYTFKTVHVSELIRPPKARVAIPRGSQVLVKKYGLNEAFGEYLRAKAIETEWSGSYFYSHPENLPSNISNEAFGFFSTCSVLVDTLIAE